MKEAHRNCNPCEPTKENQRIRFVSPHHRAGPQNSDPLLKLAKEIKLKISQNMGVSQKSLASIFFFTIVYHIEGKQTCFTKCSES